MTDPGYNKICPLCMKRYCRDVGNSRGWIDIERCAPCAVKASRRQLESLKQKNFKQKISRAKQKSRALALVNQDA